MVCNHCKLAVENQLKQIPEIKVDRVSLGLVELLEPMPETLLPQVREKLEAVGFELIDDQRSLLIKEIKTLLIAEIHHQAGQRRAAETISDFVARKMGYDYSYLNELFSALEGKTIGQYAIFLKIEKVKELLVYDEMNLTEIALQLDYSSAQYLSAQFKKFTGMTPSYFKQIGPKGRKSLDQL
jgi:AraC family transcriptional regulator